MKNRITSNMENYLEIILLLESRNGHAHVKELAKTMEIKMPSVSGALKKLKREKLVNYTRYASITLTRKGSLLARKILKRHKTLHKFLSRVVGVEESIAEQDACRIEHVISSQTLAKIEKLVRVTTS